MFKDPRWCILDLIALKVWVSLPQGVSHSCSQCLSAGAAVSSQGSVGGGSALKFTWTIIVRTCCSLTVAKDLLWFLASWTFP